MIPWDAARLLMPRPYAGGATFGTGVTVRDGRHAANLIVRIVINRVASCDSR
ncbi:predicted hydrolases or acyltransferases [Microbacterium sp. HM58-2]|nr:predicted hydrolases or acyltransferases [Microbacterium sp. HM58-2]